MSEAKTKEKVEDKIEQKVEEKNKETKKGKQFIIQLPTTKKIVVGILVAIVVGGGAWEYYDSNLGKNESLKTLSKNVLLGSKTATVAAQTPQDDATVKALMLKVIPPAGVELPVTWKDLGKQLIDKGVIDKAKFEEIYAKQGGLTPDQEQLLSSNNNGKIKITPENAPILLNLLWALGLGNKNDVLDKGPMVDPKYGGAGKFAATGGWSISSGDAMTHYSKHAFITLTASQQAMVERVSKGIYRPCCDNPTYFPDCNHGMAMLGLLELMASQGVSEGDMYKAALQVNSYWFGDTYLTIAQAFEKSGTPWENVDPKVVLGKEYSSASGYKQVQAKVAPIKSSDGAGCGV